MTELFSDVRFAARRLIAQRGFTITAVVTLALSIGVNAVMLDVLDRLLLRDPPGVRHPEDITRLYFGPETVGVYPKTDYATFADLQKHLGNHLSAIATYYNEKLSLGRGQAAVQVHVTSCTPDYFSVLGLEPSLGVFPSSKGHEPPDSAVISHALWHQYFGARPDIVGSALRLGNQAFTIVGVAPKRFVGIDSDTTDVWLPLEMRGEMLFGESWKTSSRSGGYSALDVIARFKPGASRRGFEIAATQVFRSVNVLPYRAKMRVVAGELLAARSPNRSPEVDVAVWIAAVSALVLLIGCGNVAGLVLVRGIARSRELAVKAAVGATRLRLAREILVEAVLLGALSSVVAMVVVAWGDAAVPKLFDPSLWATVPAFDARLVGLTASISALAALMLGAIPALQLSSSRSLAGGYRLLVHRGHSRTLDALLVFQLALTVPLLVGSGLFITSFAKAKGQNTGLRLERIVIISTNLGEFGEPHRNHDAHREIVRRLSSTPGVEASALVTSIPLMSVMGFVIDTDDPTPPESHESTPWVNIVDPAYLKVMGIAVVRGRPLMESDNRPGARRVAVVNETMDRTFLSNGSLLGRCIYVGGRQKGCTEVVGVTRNAWLFTNSDTPSSFLVPIEPFKDLTTERAVVVRTTRDPSELVDLLRRTAQSAGPDLPYVEVWPLYDVFASMLHPWKLGAAMFVGFGLLALTISAIGLAGTIAYSVQRRRRELGIRKALGAQDTDLVGTVLRRTAAVALAGLAVGLAGALISGSSLKALLFGIEPTEWRVYAVAAVLMLLVAAIASVIPARRAVTVDPTELLRSE